MIYKYHDLVLKKTVDEICLICVQNFWDNAGKPDCDIFEKICQWCYLKLHYFLEEDLDNNSRLDRAINSAYCCQWPYGEQFLDAKDFCYQSKESVFDGVKNEGQSDLQIFQSILNIVSTEHSATKVKERVNEFLHLKNSGF